MKNILSTIIICFLILFLGIEIYGVAFVSDELYLQEDGKEVNDDSVIITYDGYKKVCQNGKYSLGQQFSRNLTFYKTKEPNLMNYEEWMTQSLLKDEECAGYITKEKEWKENINQFERENEDYIEGIKQKVMEEKTREGRVRLWKELNDKKIAFMHEKGFTFYNNPVCNKYNSKEYEEYLQKHIDNALYFNTVIIPEPEDKEVRGDKEGIRGIIGTKRCFDVDIKTGEVKEIYCLAEKDIFLKSKKLIYIIGLIILLAIIFVIFLLKKKRIKENNY